MRIGIFSDVYLPYVSGVVTAVDDLKKALEKKGHEVFIITINGLEKKHRYIDNGHVIRIPGIPSGIYDYSFRLTYPFKAIKKVKNLKLDIIHTHTEFNICRFGKSMAKRLNIPVVHTFHTLYDESMMYVTKGYFPNLSKKAVIAYIKTYLKEDVKEIIVPTEKVANIFKNGYKIKRNVHIIPSGVNVELFYKEKYKQKEILKLKKELGINENDFVVSYIGRIGPEKRIDFLIENYVKIIQKYPNAKFLLVGSGPAEEDLKKIIEKYNIAEKVIFTGRVDHKSIGKYYQLATVLATASHYETQGLTVIESFAASKPVVCVNDESFTKIVKDGYNGKIFRSKREYQKILEDLIKHPKKVENMGNNARITAEDYSLDSFANKILAVYNKALEEYVVDKDK